MSERIAIAGGPRTGKTTLSEKLCHPAQHTDDLLYLKLDLRGHAELVAQWFDAPGPWVIEGVAVPRALRKWLADHKTGTPCDRVIWMPKPRLNLTRGQRIMTKGIETVWREILPELRRRGVHIETHVD